MQRRTKILVTLGPSTDDPQTLRKMLAAAGQELPETKPILEVNLGHALVARLGQEQDATRREDLAHLLYDQAALGAGEALANPALFVQRLNRLLLGA